MLRILLLTTMVSFTVSHAKTCNAQIALMKRIKAIQNVSIWQRPKRSNSEIRQLIKQLRDSDKEVMQAAFEKLTLTRPVPAAADTVVEQATAAARQNRDKFALSMAFEIKGDWTEARKAAETLQIAQRNGGLRYLEQLIVRGNPARASGPLIAAAYSGNAQAARLVAQYWRKSRIPGKRAILIIGPAVAPELAKQLAAGDRSAQMEIAELLGKIGTEKQIPAIEALASKADANLRKRIDESVGEIKSRESKKSTSKKS